MLRGVHKVLVAVTVALPLVTFATGGGPAGAIPSAKLACFGVRGAKGDTAIVNLTPVLATAAGDGQLVPLESYKNPPRAANVNFGPGTIDPNVAFTRVGAKGSVCFDHTGPGDVELVADHLGTIKGRFYSRAQRNGAPKLVLDTRNGGRIGPRGKRCFKVAGRPGDAAVVNLTPVKANRAGDGQLVSSKLKKKPPTAANVNYARGTVDPNVAIATIGNDNKVCYINSAGASVHLVAYHLGTIKANAYTPARTNGASKRVADTRKGSIVGPKGRRCFKVAGRPGDAAVVNLTPVKANRAGNGQLVSSNVRKNPPTAANVNYARGTVDPNVAIATIGNDNKVCYVNSANASVHLVADHLGTIKAKAYTPARTNGAPKRVLDTRTEAEVTPVRASGPNPLRPSQVDFTCGYRFAAETSHRLWDEIYNSIQVRGLDKRAKIVIRITRYNPYDDFENPMTYINQYYANPRFSWDIWREFGPYDLHHWNQRIKIETYVNDPARHSSAVFDISAVCVHGDA